jgi:hydroxyacylglutathione hydrolase
MRISENVTLVGSGQLGFEISHPMDCNVFLLDGGTEYALVDAGSGIEPERLVRNIEQASISMEQVKYLLLTHVHGDHAAGASFFHNRFGMEVVCSVEAAPWLEQGDMEKTSLLVAKQAGVYPEDFTFEPCPVASAVVEGDVVEVGSLNLEVLETPGHSRGHISFLWDDAGASSLFAGDTVFAGGRIITQLIWDCSIQDYAQTTRKLNQLCLDRLYPGHGSFLLSRAYQHIDQANAYFEKLQIPPNLV